MAESKIAKTVTVIMRGDQAEVLAKFLGEHRMAELPKEAALTVYYVHNGLRAMENHADIHTLNITEIDL